MGNIEEELTGQISQMRRNHTMEAYDNTSWANGHLSLQHFANENRWVSILDAETTAALMRRWDRACQLSECHVVSRGHDYQVTSQSDPSIRYIVDLQKGCTCPDAQAAPFGWCKHRLAAWQYQQYLDQEQERYRASMATYATLPGLEASIDRIMRLAGQLSTQKDGPSNPLQS